MFAPNSFILFVFTVLLLVSAHPVVIDGSLRASLPVGANPLQGSGSQAPLSGSTNSTKRGSHTLQDLFFGNQKFRQNTRLQAERLENEDPSFMFLGCVDNRLGPGSIFNTPTGSFISHNNIGNQFSSRDTSAHAAISYAVEYLHIQHIVVLGHYGCKGVENAITKSSKASRMLRDWIQPIVDLYSKSRRAEIVILRDSRLPRRGQSQAITTAPPASDAGFRALVEENVKRSVKELRKHSVLNQVFSKRIKDENDHGIDVFVHGFVYDEGTGEVHDLHVSFGPPGKVVPRVPFKALAAAKNFHRDSDRPGISRGKTWEFGPGK